MRRAVITCLIIAMACCTASEALAFGAYLSYWNGEDTDSAWGGGVKWKFLSLPLINADVRGSWLGFDAAGESSSIVPLEVTGYVDIAMVYAGLGAGYYVFTDADNAGGANFLLGAKIAPFGIGAFAEYQYQWLKTEVEGIDLDASGHRINLGVLFLH